MEGCLICGESALEVLLRFAGTSELDPRHDGIRLRLQHRVSVCDCCGKVTDRKVVQRERVGPLPLLLLPGALIFLIGYSYTKRFTLLSHFILGFTDGLAPAGAWVAVSGSLFTLADMPAWILTAVVTLWIIGIGQVFASSRSWIMAASAVIIGALVLVLGMIQSSLMVGELHWIIQVIHLLLGITAIGVGHMAAARARKGAAA